MDPALPELWARYFGDRSLANRAVLMEAYYPLVQRIARTYHLTGNGSFCYEDLASSGVFGLADAINRFDPTLGAPFEAYAAIRIRGSMADALRAIDWAPRSLRRKIKRLDAARATGRARGSEPTHAAMAADMELSADSFAQLLADVDATYVTSIDIPAISDRARDTLPSAAPDPLESALVAESDTTVHAEMALLTERQQGVLNSYYWKDQTLATIGKDLGVTESRVSQIRVGAQGILRARLTVEWRMG